MKVSVDADACTGCALCEEICPEVFEMGDDIAKVKVSEVPAELEDKAKEAAGDCPSEAIAIE